MPKEKDLETRTRRAQAMVAMGLVKRADNRFLIGAKSLTGKPQQPEVWRNDQGKVRCTCDEFAETIQSNPNFRCEHIIAVKLLLAPTPPEEMKKAGATLLANQPAEQQTPAGHDHSAQVYTEHKLTLVDQGEQEMTALTPNPTPEPAAIDNGILHPLAFQEVLAKLSEPIPGDLIKQREGWRGRNGETHFVDYIEWHTAADLLDRAAPGWSHAVRAVIPIGDLVAVTVSITIHGVTREGIGTGSAESETGIKKAEHDALKRAAVKFGVARELYKHADDGEELLSEHITTPPLPHDPLAKTLADLVTPKQLVAIRAIAHAQGLQADDECLALYGCKLEELSRRAASALIDHLKSRPEAEPEQWRRAV